MKHIIKTMFYILMCLFCSIPTVSAQDSDDQPGMERPSTWDYDLNFPNNVNIFPSQGNDTVPPMEVRAILKCSVYNTFNKVYLFTAFSQVNISVNSSVPCNVYLFITSNPQQDSHSTKITTNTLGRYYGNITWTVNHTGNYMILIMPRNGYTTGLCNVSINSDSFSNAAIGNNYHSYVIDNNYEYNIFTNRSSEDFKLCAFEGNDPGVVVAFSDNYSGSGDFNWGNNPRIKKHFNNDVSGVAVFPAFSQKPKMNLLYTDLYLGCRTDTSVRVYFPALKADDVIRTAPRNVFYNCIAWAGGNWKSFEDPTSINSQYYDPNPLTAFDKYFNSRGFTRTGATEANAAIDLWANNEGYTHASVKNKAHDFATGYDWESKAGGHMRFMHPRYALSDTVYGIYGNVVEHYTPIVWPYTATDEVGENTSFSSSEISFINSMKSNLPTSVINTFNEKYTLLVNDSSCIVHSILGQYMSSPYYTQLLQLCLTYQNAIALAYEKLNEGDILASLIIEGVNLPQNLDVIQAVWHYNDSLLTNTSIRRTNLANATMYSKGVIAKQMGSNMNIMFEDTSYSNDERIFDLRANGGQIEITLPLDTPSNVSVFLARSDGQYMKTIIRKRMDVGIHNFGTASPAKGIYTVHVVINGRVYSKKVVVN